MGKILITGITGFLGSHLAHELIDSGNEIFGLKRPNSDVWRCEHFKHRIQWLDIIENESLIDTFRSLKFDAIIHSSWIGVEANERSSWREQSKNITFLVDLLEAAKITSVKKMIFLGSQAEYGYAEGVLRESDHTNASNAYGATKLASLEIVKSFCSANNIDWAWLRLFSVFGEKQSDNWLVPTLIKAMQKDRSMDMTLGEQKYAYLYVKDFSSIVKNVLLKNIDSGVYNVSSETARSIKSLVSEIRDFVNPSFVLNFGAIAYREHQSMHIEGSMEKLYRQIGHIALTEHKQALGNTINYYMKKNNHESI